MKLLCRALAPLTLLFMGLPVPAARGQMTPASHETAPVAGTYAVRICRPACGPSEAPGDRVEGRLVIEDAAYPWASIPQPGRTYAFRHGRFLLVRGRTELDPNACFVLRRTPGSRILAGSPPVGFTAWTPDTSAGTLKLRLSQTPDASYILEMRISEQGASGRGTEYGPRGTSTLTDSVAITWTGPPDRSICTAAAIRGGVNMAVTDSVMKLLFTDREPSPPGGIAGTYRVEFCPRECRENGRRPVRGTLVIEDTSYFARQLTAAALRYAIARAPDLLSMAYTPNACFVFEAVGGAASYVGKQPIGFTRWSAVEPAGTMLIALFATSEGEYTARLALAGDRLTGEGWSLVNNPFDDPIPSDVIRGRRVGPPDRGLCIRAAERAGADLPPAP